jgi:NAD(P)H-flavin reductase
MVTQNWRWSENVVIKLFPDTVLFYFFLEVVILVFAMQAKSETVRRVLAKRVVRFRIGHLLLTLWFAIFMFLFTWYWAVEHLFGQKGFLEVSARTCGVVAAMLSGLLFLPASKSSPVLAAAGVSWESALWVHICIAVLFSVACVLHVLFYFIIFVQIGSAANILPFYPKVTYPENTPSDNMMVPLMNTVFWPAVIIFGVFPWMRRKSYELFRYSHNYFLILVPTMFWHACHIWYFLLPGLMLWVFDRCLRFLRASESVAVQGYTAHSIDCWTDPKPFCPPRNVPEKITAVAFTWPGQARVHSPGMYVLVNFPQVSLGEWHPFSLSSSPLDSVSTVHVKSMGESTFTGKLHSLMSKAPNCCDIAMNIQGPYGPMVNVDASPHLLLIAGGIGATPMINTLRFAMHEALEGRIRCLKRLHFVWSVRSLEVLNIFQDELALIGSSSSPFECKVSFYCSTEEKAQHTSMGIVSPGMPNFTEVLACEAALGHCVVRICGPPPMVNACTLVAEGMKDMIDFEAWSFVL